MAVSPCPAWCAAYARIDSTRASLESLERHYSATEARPRLRRPAVLEASCLSLTSTGLRLWVPGGRANGAPPHVRHGVGRWRVAADQFPAAHCPGDRGTPEEPSRCGDHDDICEPLHQSGVAGWGAGAGGDCPVQ